MSDIAPQKRSLATLIRKVPQWVWVVSIAAITFAVISNMILANYSESDVQFRLDLSRLFLVSISVQIHIASALTAFFLGLWMLAGPKGTGMHKKLGWIWVAAMGTTSISSFFITGLNGDSYSWIHGLSAWTVIGLPMGIYAIRRKQVQKHAKAMTGMFLGGMVIAGLFTFLPGRFMWSLFFTI